MGRGIGPNTGAGGGLTTGAYIGGLIVVGVGHEPLGWVLIGCALIAHAIRDQGGE